MKLKFNNIIIIVLLVLSVVFFGLQQLIFGKIKDSLFYILQDLMFLPINILLVTFILNKALESREKREKLEQLNIVIGAFFSEAGTDAIESLSPCMSGFAEICRMLDMKNNWNDAAFEEAAQKIKAHAHRAEIDSSALKKLKEALPPKKAYLVQMFSNPNLLEHDTFTDMLWAHYHLIDELENRQDVAALPQADIEHISIDAARSYRLLVYEWVLYMKYLKKKYPYLWSLASRKNPFAQNSVIIS
jgi:hypothetical protein